MISGGFAIEGWAAKNQGSEISKTLWTNKYFLKTEEVILDLLKK